MVHWILSKMFSFSMAAQQEMLENAVGFKYELMETIVILLSLNVNKSSLKTRVFQTTTP